MNNIYKLDNGNGGYISLEQIRWVSKPIVNGQSVFCKINYYNEIENVNLLLYTEKESASYDVIKERGTEKYDNFIRAWNDFLNDKQYKFNSSISWGMQSHCKCFNKNYHY